MVLSVVGTRFASSLGISRSCHQGNRVTLNTRACARIMAAFTSICRGRRFSVTPFSQHNITRKKETIITVIALQSRISIVISLETSFNIPSQCLDIESSCENECTCRVLKRGDRKLVGVNNAEESIFFQCLSSVFFVTRCLM